ncbi:Microsomal signal peptidase 12kDa subunit [Artemisia annua]|uniref:Signal peptidase complex subunit 1 n=1 Tax=Artemisia annua TaxID=35608 RepID=A0A2U1KYH9_ARTAN|nr:Microsomal signal peptidase 12kDa subunit [Artemisia annua]
MDWQGQKVAEQLMQIMLVVFAIGAFLTGYITESYQLMVYIYAAGVVLTTLVTVPNWPFFNLHPLKWLDPSESEKHPKPDVAVTTWYINIQNQTAPQLIVTASSLYSPSSKAIRMVHYGKEVTIHYVRIRGTISSPLYETCLASSYNMLKKDQT